MDGHFLHQKGSFENDVWNSWTKRSEHVLFKSQIKGIGDGESKIGAEFNIEPLGQNSSYDLFVNGEKWEIKKLDSDNSFRLGIEISSYYTPIISSVIRILEKTQGLNEHLLPSETKNEYIRIINSINTKSGSSKTLLLDGLIKNEVSGSNLDKVNNIIKDLHKLTSIETQRLSLYNSITGKLEDYNLLDAFKKISIESVSYEIKANILGSNDNYNKLLFINEIGRDLESFERRTLKETLNDIVRDVFSHDVKLVLVHKDYGFKPITNLDRLYCNRITSGSPRCKIRET